MNVFFFYEMPDIQIFLNVCDLRDSVWCVSENRWAFYTSSVLEQVSETTRGRDTRGALSADAVFSWSQRYA